jgi:putative Holliday junction resolvase
MKLIGIDYGKRRIGIAVTDESGCIVRGLGTIDRKTSDAFTSCINIISEEHPSLIIFGLPLDHNDNETEMSKEVRTFALKIANKTDIPIDFIDESFSSIKAQELLFSEKKKKRRTKSNIDRIAACIILDTYKIDHNL